MKKNFKYAFMGAIAFAGAVSFSACQSSDEVVENNPNFDPETNKVKTEFVINVTQPGERTRMTAANAGAGDFQGINNMNLFCYAGAPATINSMDADHKLTLTSYTTTPEIDGTDNTKTNSSSQVYTMYIPVNTTNFLFYATASLPSTTDKNVRGSLLNNLSTASTVASTTPAATDIKFNLEAIASTEETVTAPQAKLLTVLNGIADAFYDKDGSGTLNAGDITWASTTSETDDSWQALKNAFNQFTNQAHSGDVRQGSSAAILSMVNDLFPAVNDVYTNPSNDDVKGLAKAILNKIADYFTVTISGTNPNETYAWPSTGSYKTGTAAASFNTAKYPESIGLPTGSAVIVYNTAIASPAFEYINDGTSGTAAVSTAYNKFTYPSQLTYYCNSGLWQTTTGKNTTDYPQNSKDWITDTSWSEWTNTAVTAATRAVAMQDNITYGAAQLLSTIKLEANVGTPSGEAFVDNASTVTGGVVSDNVFDGSTADKTIALYVHGILIGGQPATSMYDYLPLNNDASDVIYDMFSFDGTAVTTSGVTNYTLAMDNFTTADDQATVNVALEMTANKDFYGISGKIKAGQKFYLIGSLDPTAATNTITWENHKSFKTGDRGKEVDRVFIRDAKTTATFTLKKNTLKNAYSTIPDLRSTQMLFGISVDLAWKTGLDLNVNIGQ